MKKCNSCGIEKVSGDFSPDKRAPDGLQGKCKSCCNARRKEIYQADKERFRRRQREYRLANPDIHSAIEKRSKIKNREAILAGKKRYYEQVKNDPAWQEAQKQYREETKDIKKKYDREYQVNNRDALSVKKKKWANENKELRNEISRSYKARRRMWESADSDSTTKINNWARKAEKVCKWCGVNCQESFHLDHIIPLSKGGSHTIKNLCISCPTCNVRKNAMMPEEFVELMKNETRAA